MIIWSHREETAVIRLLTGRESKPGFSQFGLSEHCLRTSESVVCLRVVSTCQLVGPWNTFFFFPDSAVVCQSVCVKPLGLQRDKCYVNITVKDQFLSFLSSVVVGHIESAITRNSIHRLNFDCLSFVAVLRCIINYLNLLWIFLKLGKKKKPKEMWTSCLHQVFWGR